MDSTRDLMLHPIGLDSVWRDGERLTPMAPAAGPGPRGIREAPGSHVLGDGTVDRRNQLAARTREWWMALV